MDPEQTLNSYFALYVPRIEEGMRQAVNGTLFPQRTLLPSADQPAIFNTMLNYHLGFADADGTPAQVYSGKRIRPVLTMLACEACGGNTEHALHAAVAVELLHNFSLIHDDIEDRDELRRGRPTLWKLWGEAQAINAGDAMFSLAHIVIEMAYGRGVDAVRTIRALNAFDHAAIALTIGQHLDLSFETRTHVTTAEYMAMISGKTAALTEAACAIGAIFAGTSAERVSALGRFGAWLGIAFQLQDDVLGIWGDPTLTGKQDSDLSHGKKTLPVLFAAEKNKQVHELYFGHEARTTAGILQLRQLIETCGGRDHTEQEARQAYINAIGALDEAHIDGPAAVALRELARSLLGREV